MRRRLVAVGDDELGRLSRLRDEFAVDVFLLGNLIVEQELGRAIGLVEIQDLVVVPADTDGRGAEGVGVSVGDGASGFEDGSGTNGDSARDP